MKSRIPSLLVVATLVAGCGTFDRRGDLYQQAASREPIQVPSDLDQPVIDDALRIPERGTAASSDVRRVAVPRPGGAASVTAGQLLLEDSAEGAWRRVGLALARLGGDVQVIDSDQSAGRYRVLVTRSEPAQGMVRRLFRRDRQVTEEFDLQLTPATAGTEIRVVGGGRGAHGVLERLRQRLG